MARPRGNKFQADVMIDGRRVRTTFDTLAGAEAYEKAVHKGAPASSAITFKAFHEDHFNYLWGDNKRPDATRFNLASLDDFIPSTMPLSEITTSYIVSITAKMKQGGVSNSTINRRLSALSRILKHAERLEITKRPPIDFLREPKGRERTLSQAEERKVDRYFRHVGLRRSWAVTFFLLYTGCRLGEVFTLNRDRVVNGKAMFHYTITKTSKTRLVPLVGPARDAWELICQESELDCPFSILPKDTYRGHWTRLKQHLKLEDDTGFVPHMLRHTCASRLVSNGIPLAKVMLWMGHTSIQTTMRYAHLAPHDLEEAAASLWHEPI